MRVARWRWLLVPMVVVVAGCLPSAGPDIPASFTEEMGRRGHTFSATSASLAEASPDAVVQAIRARYTSQVMGRAVPVFGVVTCIVKKDGCLNSGPFTVPGDERPVWLVIFPDVTGPAGDVAWVLVGEDDDNRTIHDPRE